MRTPYQAISLHCLLVLSALILDRRTSRWIPPDSRSHKAAETLIFCNRHAFLRPRSIALPASFASTYDIIAVNVSIGCRKSWKALLVILLKYAKLGALEATYTTSADSGLEAIQYTARLTTSKQDFDFCSCWMCLP